MEAGGGAAPRGGRSRGGGPTRGRPGVRRGLGAPSPRGRACRPTAFLHRFLLRGNLESARRRMTKDVKTPPNNHQPYPIVVHSHLRWDWVWQRPQQFLSRLAAQHPVLFVEEPMPVQGMQSPRAVLREVPSAQRIMVLTPEIPSQLAESRPQVDALYQQVLHNTLAGPLGRRFQRPVHWFYDPMAAPLFAGKLQERAIVYDCMDELSQFRGAPPELIRREHELLALADVVFAGGPKIHRSKARSNPNCHCYGCGVDVAHFSAALLEETILPEDVRELPKPILGYFGVVDERIDYALLEKLADTCPHTSIVMVGPLTKVDPAHIPQRPNLHWLGGRDYGQLPAYAKAFDLCMMPFVLNESTEFINPTKALEYMATGRPIVSTAIDDVVLQFSAVVRIADSHTHFIQCCREILERACANRINAGLKLAKRNSWESIVAKLQTHIAQAIQKRERSEICAA